MDNRTEATNVPKDYLNIAFKYIKEKECWCEITPLPNDAFEFQFRKAEGHANHLRCRITEKRLTAFDAIHSAKECVDRCLGYLRDDLCGDESEDLIYLIHAADFLGNLTKHDISRLQGNA